MSPELLWAWMFWVALAAILIAVAVGPVRRAAAEARRIAGRVKAYGDLPIAHAGERAGREAARIARSLDRLPELQRRAEAAIAAIRAARFVPTAITGAFAHLEAELAAFRYAARREER